MLSDESENRFLLSFMYDTLDNKYDINKQKMKMKLDTPGGWGGSKKKRKDEIGV